MIRLTLFLCIVLAGCVPQSGALVSEDTGLSGRFSAQVPISDHMHHVLHGHVIESIRSGETIRALVISHRRDGVHSLRFQEAWTGGIELPFSRSGALNGCSHGHCLNRHAGMILLSDALFTHAQTHGLQARLIGGQDNVDISVPASLFNLPQS